jgi:hypothetical protein
MELVVFELSNMISREMFGLRTPSSGAFFFVRRLIIDRNSFDPQRWIGRPGIDHPRLLSRVASHLPRGLFLAGALQKVFNLPRSSTHCFQRNSTRQQGDI